MDATPEPGTARAPLPLANVHPDDVAVVREAFEVWSVSGLGARSPIEFRLFTVDGSVRWVRCIRRCGRVSPAWCWPCWRPIDSSATTTSIGC